MLKLPLLSLTVFLFVSCKVNSFEENLTQCRDFELIMFKHPELGMNVKIPSNWETDIDFVFGDTISVFSIDTTYDRQYSGLTAFSFFQFSTKENEETNFGALQSILLQEDDIELLAKGDLQVRTNRFKFLLLYETIDNYPMTNLVAFKQDGTEVIHCFNRLEGRKRKLKDFCLFAGILEEIGK